MGHIRQERCFSERGTAGWGGEKSHTSWRLGSCCSIALHSRWVTGRRHLYYTCTCSKGQTGWPGAGRVRPPGAGAQIQQKYLQPASDARSQMPWNGPTCSCRALYHNGSKGSHHLEIRGSTSRRHVCSSYTSSVRSPHPSLCRPDTGGSV